MSDEKQRTPAAQRAYDRFKPKPGQVIPVVRPDELPDNRMWLKIWDAPYSPESPQAIEWAVTQGWEDANDWHASDLYRRGLEQFNAGKGATEE